MPICTKCHHGFDSDMSFCPNCKTTPYFNNYPLSRFWLGQGVLLLLGLIISVMLDSSDPFSIAMLISYIWMIFWVYVDAEKRGKPGCAVALLIFFLSWIGLLLWFIFRP